MARAVPAALSFDGSDDILTVADEAALQITDRITIMGWARLSGPSEQGYLCGRLNSASNGGYGILLQPTHGAASTIALAGLSAQLSVTGLVPSEQMTDWRHYAFSYDATAASGSRPFRAYLDGNLIYELTNRTETIPAQAGLNFLVGNRTGGSSAGTYIGGLVRDVRVYNAALTADEVARCCVGDGPDGVRPVLHLPLDDATGVTARNLGSTLAGTISGATWVTTAALMPFRARTLV